jgi:hypothetical protein
VVAVLFHNHALVVRHHKQASCSSSNKHAHPHRAHHSNSILRTARVVSRVIKPTRRTGSGTGTARRNNNNNNNNNNSSSLLSNASP